MSIMKKITYLIAGAAMAAAFVFFLITELPLEGCVLFLIMPLALLLLWKTECTEEKELAYYRETGYFPGGRPLWKRIGRGAVKVFLLLVIGGVLQIFYEAFFGYGYCMGCERSTYNSNAKLTYTNTATYLTKLEALGGDRSDMDGTYWGSLKKEQGEAYELPLAVDGSRENFDHAMKTIMGSERAEVAGCYYVVIKGGIPVQAFWSKSDELLYFAGRYAERFGQGEIEGDFYAGGEFLGSYPTATIYAAETPPEWLKLTFSDRMRICINHIRKNIVYYKILIAPLLIYLITGLLMKIGNKMKKETPASENV